MQYLGVKHALSLKHIQEVTIRYLRFRIDCGIGEYLRYRRVNAILTKIFGDVAKNETFMEHTIIYW